MTRDPTSLFLDRLRQSVQDDSFILLRLRAADTPLTEVRLIELKSGRVLSFTNHEARQTTTKNFPIEEGIVEITRLLARGGSAWLESTAGNFQLIVPENGRARFVGHKRIAPAGKPEKTTSPARQHNREKQSRLAGANDWLSALDLVDANGTPRSGRGDKLRQIERYADLLAHFAADCGWKAGDKIALADMGCGKGYLTFAAWHVLRRALKIDAEITGLEAQPALVAACEETARKIGAEKIFFRAGKIEAADLPPLDALIALHACNDATDAALARGVALGAKLIVVAPCCHKAVRRALGAPEPLAPLLEHGIFKERFAEWLTDGLRVLALEAAGYRVTTSEFVAAEHTPKNLLIAGVRGNSDDRRRAAAAQLAAIKSWAGLGPLPLDALLNASAPPPVNSPAPPPAP